MVPLYKILPRAEKYTLLNKCIFTASLTMDVCTDQQTISQDCPTENECINKQEFIQDWLKDQQEISEEWPTKESFKRREILNGEIFQTMYTKLKRFHTGIVNMGFQLF